MRRAIVLIGLSGSGKSTVGRLVAAALGVSFLDTDDLIAAHAGSPVHQIFALQGEQHFRDLETEVITGHVARLGPSVVATGGGAVLRATNRAALAAGSFVVWLDAPPAVLAARLAGHTATPDERPLLRDGDPAARLAAMAAVRGPVYASCAALRLDTAELTPEQASAAIVDAVGAWWATDEREARRAGGEGE
jgi:shikimate kinase